MAKPIPLTLSKSLYGFSLTEAGPNASGSSSSISVKLFFTLSERLSRNFGTP